jgi:hypothetical protein
VEIVGTKKTSMMNPEFKQWLENQIYYRVYSKGVWFNKLVSLNFYPYSLSWGYDTPQPTFSKLYTYNSKWDWDLLMNRIHG